MQDLNYCKKCGRMVLFMDDSKRRICDCCGSVVYPIPEEFLEAETKTFVRKELKEDFINRCIKASPEFDRELYEKRDSILLKKDMEISALLVEAGNKGGVSCTYCGSNSVRKIGAVSRMVSGSLFGLGSSKIGKQWHCNSCGSDF